MNASGTWEPEGLLEVIASREERDDTVHNQRCKAYSFDFKRSVLLAKAKELFIGPFQLFNHP